MDAVDRVKFSVMVKYIIISGIDGSGKTTVINALQERLQRQGARVSYIWMRYNHYLIKVMNAIARLLGLSVKVHNAMGDIWEHRLYKKKWFCKLYVCCSYIDNCIARRKVTRLSAEYVICDRWVNDILIDLGAEGRMMDILKGKWYKRFQELLPNNSYQFVVKRDLNDVLGCRVENNTNPDFQSRFLLYQELMKKSDVYVVDNTGSIEDSVSQILDVIS